jgi:hypothetical protein
MQKVIAHTKVQSGVDTFQGQHQAGRGKVILPEEKSKAEIIQAKDHRLAGKEFFLHLDRLADVRVQLEALPQEVVIVPFPEECNEEAEQRMPDPLGREAGIIMAGQLAEEMRAPTVTLDSTLVT